VRPLFLLFRDAYSGLPAATWLLSAAAFINRSGSMVVPYLSLYLKDSYGLSAETAGLFISAYGVGSILGNLLGGRLCDRVGPVRLQILALGGAWLWFWLLAVISNAWLLAGGLFVLGAINDAFRPGNITAVVESCAPELRPRALALNRLAINAGWAIGPTVGGYLAQVDFTWLFLADGLTCGLAAAFLFWRRRSLPQTSHRHHGDSVRVSPFADRRFLAIAALSVLLLLAFMQYFTTETRYLNTAFGFDKNSIGWLLAINPIVIIVCEMPLVHALRSRRQLPLVACGALLVGAGLALLPLRGGMPLVLLSMLVLTLGEMLWSPFLGAYVSDRAPANGRGRYLGAYASSFSVAFVLAPGLGGMVYDRLSADALWYLCGVLGTAVAIGFWLLAVSDRELAEPAPSSTPAADLLAAATPSKASAETAPE